MALPKYTDPGRGPGASQSRFRLWGTALVVAALLLGALFLVLFWQQDAPSATREADAGGLQKTIPLNPPLPAEAPPVDRVIPTPVVAEVPPPPEQKAELQQLQIVELADHGYALGFVANTGAARLEQPRVDLVFRDAAGVELGRAFGFAELDLLEPGMRAPIKMVFHPFPTGYAKVAPTFELHEPYVRTKRLARLTILTHRLDAENPGFQKIRARIRNDDRQAVKFAKVVVTLFDAGGLLIGVDSGFAADKTLAPGAESDVTIMAYVPGGQSIGRYELVPAADVYER